ncbi:hypothetical protein WMY93_015119 [Mugilogobius chulae]|uniref:Uncharacterized protein n=1 Tax=Mugilogobius chulae TaxID=88201 RepID=A0AAW0P397_9GOBI
MEDGPNKTDNTVTTGTNNTKKDRILRECSCGWSKVTSYQGLRIHQGKAKCSSNITQMQACTATAGQTKRIGGQDEHHSATEPTTASREVEHEQDSVDIMQQQTLSQPHHPPKPTSISPEMTSRKTRSSGQSPVKQLEARDRFGELQQRKAAPIQQGRREREILKLVKERRLLRKSWRKASDNEKEGLKNLWNQLRGRLAQLRRAERIRKRRSRKEKARAKFFQDPFKYARSLLEEKRSGILSTTEEELAEYIAAATSDSQRNTSLGPPGYLPQPQTPPHHLIQHL